MSKAFPALPALTTSIILGLCGLVLATNGTPTWSLSLVSTPSGGQYVSSPALAFDHYGTPSTSYSLAVISGTNSVQHAQLTGLGLWSSRELASGTGLGIRTAIAFDRSERPTVTWVNDTGTVQGQFNYGSNLAIAASGANVSRPIVGLYYDLAGTLRGMYSNANPGDFSSIGFNGSSFSSAAMTNIPAVSSVLDAKMVVNDRGLRQIAARTSLNAGGQALSLSSEPAGGPWANANLAVADSVDGVDISIDPTNGALAVAYTTYNAGTNTSKLLYSKFNGASIATTEILSSTAFRYQDVSLAFDRSDGRPAIAYERRVTSTSGQEMWYGFLNVSSVWQQSLIDGTISMDAPFGMPRAPSLAFDDFGTSWPAVAYVDANGSLNVAFDPPSPEPSMFAFTVALSAMLIRSRARRDRLQSGRRQLSNVLHSRVRLCSMAPSN